MTQYNFRMIALARESRSLTQAELSKRIPNLNQGNLSKIERDELKASDQILNEIAAALNYPLNFFYQNEVKTPVSSFYYRKKASIGKKSLHKIEATINIVRKAVDGLLNEEGIEMDEFNFLKLDVNDGWKPETAANRVREFLKIPKGPIKNPIQFLENAGIIVYEMDLEDEGFDGITTFTDSGRPILFINKRIPNDRKRFTLGHELAHLVLHIPFVLEPYRDEEVEANRFSSEFFMPKADCKNDLIRFSFSKVGALKQYWGWQNLQ